MATDRNRRRLKFGRSDDHFTAINERRVDDISLDFFYTPHTISLLTGVFIIGMYTAFTRNDAITEDNIWTGMKALMFMFLVISVLCFPNGPFTRPHPAVWRLICGLSVMYLMFLQFILYQNFRDIKGMLRWLDPERLNRSKLEEKEYAVNCSIITVERVMESVDFFAFAHFAGWAMKALLIRHSIICWYISITWEITEIAFYHLLPNFQECWWDAIVLDILLCNGLGIWFGLFVCKKLEMRTFHWESIKNIPSTRGKLRRAVMQFTPESWTHVRWLDPNSSFMRVLAVWKLVVIWQISELNAFFIKHIFAIVTEHPINMYRIWLIALISAPALRQYYSYVTDPQCTRIGVQAWVYSAIMLTEALICIKFGFDIFAQTQLRYIGLWLLVLLLGSVLCVYLCILTAKRAEVSEEKEVNGDVVHEYLDSSVENLNTLSSDDEQRPRRRRRVVDSTEETLDNGSEDAGGSRRIRTRTE